MPRRKVMAGISTASTCSRSSRRKTVSSRTRATPCIIRPRSNSARPSRPCWRRPSGSSRRAWCSIHCLSCAYWRKIRCATAVRSSHSNNISRLVSLDLLLGGGLAKGTSTLIMGAAGTGKSSLATQYARVIAASGQHASIFLFDEAITTFKQRSANLGIDVENLINEGMLNVQQVDPAELAPGEFAHAVRQAVDQQHTQLVVIDSLNGYLNAMPSDRFLTLHMHELLTYLNQQGVTTLLLMAQNGLIGTDTRSPIDASYIADTVMLLRYFEAFGEVRQAISVIKKRTGRHERSIRELKLDHGIVVGPPLRDFHGILQGAPQFISHGLERDLEHKQ